MNPQHKFVFFGTPNVASETLAILIQGGYTPALVVTSPAAPRGRGLVLTPSPVESLAHLHHIPVLTPERLDDAAIAAIAAHGATYGVCVAYGKIFPEALITQFPKGVLNVHYSLLPKYRGATPLETALLAGEEETGVTVQQMVRELDAGDILAQVSTPIGAQETAKELRPRLITLGAELLLNTLPSFEAGTATRTPQDSTLATRARKIEKSDGLLDLTGDAQKNWNTYRAYADSIGTYFFENGTRMKITDAECAGGTFRVLRITPEGKRERAY